ncbi:FMN-dependent NADH-azoreductase [Meridianimarinicoccus sp. RP-17]|uniref:FMN-dependent NADH-azoreductase n=1 Tax=Meridianimarinicoccus zhengii TaxID=2056810 RepID=UPI000DADB883|nr:NAD(P)H-dependent oxidoreductase [Phycocomes zhengii]
MTRILRIDASARAARSLSRKLGDQFIDEWTAREPDVEVLTRDVGMTPPPIITEAWIAAVFSVEMTADQRELTRTSDELIAEVAAADVIVFTTPMYNYGMPAALKAWFDQVVRVNKTFSFDLARGDRPLVPVLSGKTVVALTSWGEFGFGPGEMNDGGDMLVPHLRFASRYLGMSKFHHVGIEYQEFGDHRHEASKAAASRAVGDLVSRLACPAASRVA